MSIAGVISSNGSAGVGNTFGGGGSGGSIFLEVQGHAFGSGRIDVIGGATSGKSGRGAGGRLSIMGYQSLAGLELNAPTLFSGSGYYGAAGTIYLENHLGESLLTIDAQGLRSSTATITEFVGPTTIPGDMLITGSAQVGPPTGDPLDLHVEGDLTIDLGSNMHADGRGHPAGKGDGAGLPPSGSQWYSGGGHGGAGGFSYDRIPGGGCYGEITQPTPRGSGGGGPSTAP